MHRPIGDNVGGRYRLTHRLGAGGHGTVYGAVDRLSGDAVAVKLLPPLPPQETFRVRREISALRALTIPGVLRLLDEGVEGDAHYLVTELVEGTPFPGTDARAWPSLQAPFLRLLEIVARMHQAGVIHRDLKPGNVMVRPGGEPVVLDFGLAKFLDGHATATASGTVLGTPQYMAPELVRGEPATVVADLYSLGVMLFEALAGHPPFGGDLRGTMLARVVRPAPSLHEFGVDAPRAVIDLVERLLSRDPSARPRSAQEALRLLREEQPPADAAPGFPHVGATDLQAALVECGLQGRAMDLGGPHGAGRTHTLEAALRHWQAEGRRVRRLIPTRRPFGSLGSLLDAVAAEPNAGLEIIARQLEAHLAECLAAGEIVVADDVERLDRWTSELLERMRSAGAVIRVVPPGAPCDAAVSPATVADLEALFEGPSRIFHLPEDAARELHRRTEGLMGRVVEEVNAWVRAGMCRWSGGRLTIDRSAIERLEGGLRVLLDSTHDHTPAPVVESWAAELVTWVDVLGVDARAETLAVALQRARWEIDAAADDLVRNGWLRRQEHTFVVADRARSLLRQWDARALAAAHRQAAELVRPGSIERLYHLLLAGDLQRVAESALPVVDAALAAGRPGRALAALVEGTAALRALESPAPETEWALLVRWVHWAARDGLTAAFDRVAFELARSTSNDPRLSRLRDLAHGALSANGQDPDHALAQLDAALALPEPELQRIAHSLRIQAGRRLPLAREAEVVDSACAWASGASATPDAAAWAAGWRGLHAYRAGRFAEASEFHEASAELHRDALPRVAATLNAASALIETQSHARAIDRARAAGVLAAEVRNSMLEGRAAWLERAATYRSGLDAPPEPDLVAAARRLSAPDLRTHLLLQEAAFAWRAGDDERAAQWAAEAGLTADQGGLELVAVLAWSFAAALGAPGADRGRLATRAAALDPDGEIGRQVRALLCMADGARPPPCPAGPRLDLLHPAEIAGLLGPGPAH